MGTARLQPDKLNRFGSWSGGRAVRTVGWRGRLRVDLPI
jgi:hypothetical protein